MKIHTPAHLAEMFDKPVSFVKKRAAAGDWPAFKVGQEWRFTDDDVAAITRIGRRDDAERPTLLTRSNRRRRRAAS